MNQNHPDQVLKDFYTASPIDATEVRAMADAVRDIQDDPMFLADLQKAQIAVGLRHALESLGETQSSFAHRWGKSRQYVSKFFDDENPTNYTIETIVMAASLLKIGATFKLHRLDEVVCVKKRHVAMPEYIEALAPFSDVEQGRFSYNSCSEQSAISLLGEA